MARYCEVVCPSGLAGTVRGLKAKEANMLAEGANKKAIDTFDLLLTACWQSTSALGPYKEGFAWDDVLVGDRFVITLGMRIATYGPEYAFKVQCPSTSCRNRFWWEINLETDLPHKTVPASVLASIAAGENLASKLPDGRAISFRLLTGKQEKQAAKLARSQKADLFTAALATRIVAIEGVEPANLLATISDLELSDVRELINTLDESDGGVDTTLNVECPECSNIIEMTLPLAREFWLPSQRLSTSMKTTT